jgi:hypothetical protein
VSDRLRLASSSPLFLTPPSRSQLVLVYLQTRTTLLKDTLSGRKNLTPQVIYEVGQLYSMGALKIACVGLRCIGFDTHLYQAILAQAKKAGLNGAWKAKWD